ncbi:transcription-repair coupling factor [Vagococcus coleopterorum]|uniref:Transcription-repair-coupling factor n=1 Tax=Vagococcus coleopterorum TaxID=2714946 RepID=A0A6G8AM88_9ENTE|nr:transcription-repair coupling factor [Vagococcus coleopterorum]QIL46045.1 transcription-repair coupling factor [Vagococcus coleopterorum]
MNINDIVGQLPEVVDWQSDLSEEKQQLITGLSSSAKALVMSSLLETIGHRTIVLTPNIYHARNAYDEFCGLLPNSEVHIFPVDEVTAIEMSYGSPETMAERIAALSFLANGKSGLVVVPVAGFRKFLPKVDTWKRYERLLVLDEELDLENFQKQLVLMGYRREGLVASPGEFSVRGSILDVYPLTEEYPVRIDLFGDEIESIRFFNPENQRSLEKVSQITIPPATDLFSDESELRLASERLESAMDESLNELSDEEAKNRMQSYFVDVIETWDKGLPHSDDLHHLGHYYQEETTLSDYVTSADFLCVDDYPRILESEKTLLEDEANWITSKLESGTIMPNQIYGKDVVGLLKDFPGNKTYFTLFQKGMGNLKFQKIIPFHYRSMQQFFGQIDLLKIELDRWKKKNTTVLMVLPDEEKLKKMQELLIDYNQQVVITTSDNLLKGEVQLIVGQLETGFELPDSQLAIITERELLQKTKSKKRPRRQNVSNAERLKSYNELKPGDYVVHVNHGIGQYIGMETLQMDGVHQDYMTILYQKNDKLFIPVTQLDLIQKYVASESKEPKINKLGGSDWSKTRNKVSAKIEDIADDLIKLYSEREAERGFSFSPDDSYQKEFEDAFPYPETEDQLRSISEIKKDMESVKPMDRLLVGDVGFGKTEVALRAAFKAIQDGKQVAILVPTTILAQQHYETMLDRFTDFPISVGLLSRFRTKKQQEETIRELEKGQLDIVVGTHRVLSNDIKFADLGLLIVDEEQRFGVKHKERLKQLKSQVDVLTLTATPIPRTLHMSMLGVRDLSVIETPPANRYPVQTYVMERNQGAIKDAVERELSRGGQVFYLHNRVDTIDKKVMELQQLIPDARIGFAHGQMSELELESTLLAFIQHEYDVLVTTTIIETGVDIPNVNTLFVENADRMGLSQLYQLRGRVGRSNRVAFAYFMYEPDKVLNEVSEKRLQAIRDFTELGAGFKIAMRDLSIRGAGNLLGAQQHGFIDSVGFDMYTQMLSEAVARKQGKNLPESKTSMEIDVGIDAYIPSDYIEDERQKIEIYKRIRQLESQEMFDELEDDLFDRFGDYPDEVGYLLSVGLLKMAGDYALVEKIVRNDDKLSILLSQKGSKLYAVEQLFKALSATKLQADIRPDDKQMVLILTIPNKLSEAGWLLEVTKVVMALRDEKYKAVKQLKDEEVE